MAARAIAELGGERDLVVRGPRPDPAAVVAPPAAAATPDGAPAAAPEYALGDKVATRKAYGDALLALGAARPEVVALDGEVSNSTHADEFAKAYPGRYFEMFIAEQQMVAAAVGLSVAAYVPFASTFAAFFTRAYDFIRMAAISQANIRLSGSHAGVEIGADGPSQMALEDLAMMRAVQGSTVLYPSDATSTAALVRAMADRPGISYLRTTRGAYPVLYETGETFPVGGSKVLRSGAGDAVTLIGAGRHPARLPRRGRPAGRRRDQRAGSSTCTRSSRSTPRRCSAAVAATGGRLVVAEDHHPEGGLGAAVTDALLAAGPQTLRVAHLAVRELPGSGTSAELLAAAGIDAPHIAAAARDLLA